MKPNRDFVTLKDRCEVINKTEASEFVSNSNRGYTQLQTWTILIDKWIQLRPSCYNWIEVDSHPLRQEHKTWSQTLSLSYYLWGNEDRTADVEASVSRLAAAAAGWWWWWRRRTVWEARFNYRFRFEELFISYNKRERRLYFHVKV